MVTTSLPNDADICETCLLNDLALDQNDCLVPRRTKNEHFSLNKLPDALIRATFEKMNQTAFSRARRTNRAVNQFVLENRGRINISLFHNWIIRFEIDSHHPSGLVRFLRFRPRRGEEDEKSRTTSTTEVFECERLMDRMEKTISAVERSQSPAPVRKEGVQQLLELIRLGRKPPFDEAVDRMKRKRWCVDMKEEFSIYLGAFRNSEILQRELKGNYKPCFYDVNISEEFFTHSNVKVNMEPFCHFLRFTNQTGGFVRFCSIRPDILNGICEVLRPDNVYLNLFVVRSNSSKVELFQSLIQVIAFQKLKIVKNVRRITITENFALSLDAGAIKYLLMSLEHLNIRKLDINRKDHLDAVVEGLMHWKLNGSALKSFIFSVDCHFTAFVYFKRLFAILDPVDLDTERCIQLSSQYPKLLEWIPVLEEVVQHEVFKPNEYFYFEGRSEIAVVTVRNGKRRFQMTVL